MSSTADHNENSPLLESSQTRRANNLRLIPQWTCKQWQVMVIASSIIFIVNFGISTGAAPQLKIFEDIICQSYINNLDEETPHRIIELDEDICKSEPVQSELALVSGWKNTLDVLLGLALAMPYGVMADNIGRRPFVILSTAAIALSECWPRFVCWFNLPIRLVWLTGLFRAPGGGDQFATFILMTIIADVFDEDERSTALFRFISLSILAEVIATPISALTMNIDPWLPYLLGPVIVLVGAAFSILVPETLTKAPARQPGEPSDRELAETFEASSSKDTLYHVGIAKAQRFFVETRFMWENPKLLISLAVVFVGVLDRSSLFLLIQYASVKYHWSISQASYLITIRGCMSLATFVVFVPLLSTFLIRRLHYSALKKDLTVACIAATSGVIGYFCVFIARSPALLIIGSLFASLSMPFVVAMISVATSFANPEHVATLYTGMSISQSIGIIVAGPAFAKLYAAGLHMGLEWSGLPFAIAASLFAVILVPVLYLGVSNVNRGNM